VKKLLFFAILMVSIVTFAQEDHSNFESTLAIAKSQNKNVLLIFSGSDWCAPCMKLEKNVFQTEIFKTEAANNWIVFKADFPKKKANALPKEIQEQNDKLAEKYNRDGNFPFVLVIDSNGKVLGRTGFKNTTAQDYITELKSFSHSRS